jgi:hypothetical protein
VSKPKGRERRSYDSRRKFPVERRFCSKGEVIDQICLGLLEGQITLREEGEKATFDAAVAFELLSQSKELENSQGFMGKREMPSNYRSALRRTV